LSDHRRTFTQPAKRLDNKTVFCKLLNADYSPSYDERRLLALNLPFIPQCYEIFESDVTINRGDDYATEYDSDSDEEYQEHQQQTYSYCMISEFVYSDTSFQSHREFIDFSVQLFDAVFQLYEKGFLHRDIKPGNILWNHRKLFLCDTEFVLYKGEADVFESDLRVGTPQFCAPETLKENERGKCVYSLQGELYAVGMTLLVLMFGIQMRLLNEGYTEDIVTCADLNEIWDLYKSALSLTREEIELRYDPTLFRLIKFVVCNLQDRLSAGDCKELVNQLRLSC